MTSVRVCVDAVPRSQILHEVAFILATVRVGAHTVAFAHICNPVTFIPHSVVWPLITAVSLLLVVLPFSLVCVGALLCVDDHFSLPMSFVVEPLPLVNGLVPVDHSALTAFLSVSPLALVLVISLDPKAASLPGHFVLRKVTFVAASIRPDELAFSVPEIVLKLAFIDAAVWKDQFALSLPLIKLVLALVLGTGRPRVHSIAVTFISNPFALVVAPIDERVRSNFSWRQLSMLFRRH